MFCPECGKEIKEGSIFCQACGAKVEETRGVGESKTLTAGMTAVAILNFIFGGIGVFSGLWGTAADRPQFFVLALLSIVVGVVAIIAGVGVLRLLPWGRTLSLGYAWASIIHSIISFSVYMSRVDSVAIAMMGVERSEVVFFVLFGLLLSGIYPVTLIFLFRKPAWKKAFSTL